MRVLVTGATGFLGSNLVQHLLSNGDSVRALVRSTLKGQHLAQLGAELAIGDIIDDRILREALQDIEIVYHLAGKLFVPGAKIEEFQLTHVEGTHILLALSKEQPRLKRFVHTSTTGILGATGEHPADELSPAQPANEYESTKWQAELLVRDAIAHGFPAVIARPAFVYGPGDLHLLGFFRSVQRGLFRPIGRRSVLMHPIFVDDMSLAFRLCGEHPRALGECFNFAGQAVTVTELTGTMADALSVKRPRGIIPMPIAQIAAKLGDMLPGKLGAMAPLTSSRLFFLTNSRVFDVSKADRLLGFIAPTDLQTGMARTVAWYREQGHLSKIIDKTPGKQNSTSWLKDTD